MAYKMPVLYDEIDPLCRDMVKLFNDVGLVTEFSCQGHDCVTRNKFEIMFKGYVKDKEIFNFISRITNDRGHTPLVGSFSKWSRALNGILESNWMYGVSYGDYRLNQECAFRDYNRMVERLAYTKEK